MNETDQEQSLAQVVAVLPDSERENVLADLDPEALQYDAQFWLRPSQLRPINETGWMLCALVAGRGYGKTRTMMEWARSKARGRPSRGAFVARTAADVRDVMVQGESGIIAVSPPSERPEYEPSKRLLTWPNGTTCLLFSSEAPDQLRGPQFDWSTADELASWKYMPDESGLTAWDNLRLATRLGEHPQVMAGTTPKRTPFMRSLLTASEEEDNILLIRGTTRDNMSNLAKTYIDTIYGLYAGTALARQELDGIMLDDIDGALWSEAMIEDTRVIDLPAMKRPIVAIGVDPSVSESPGDETGIIVAVVDGAIRDMYRRHAYILEDLSVQASPQIWAGVVAGAAKVWSAPVIAEVNQGGGLIKSTLVGVDPSIRVLPVHSKYGKAIRAEPVVLAAQQGRIHHVGYHPLLEDQLCLPGGTLVETARGHVPIEDVRAGDLVWTRNGYAPLIWAGQTGEATELSSVFYAGGCVVSTPCHPIFHPATEQFVSARSVQRGDLLDVRPSPANTVRPLCGEDDGGLGCRPGTTETPKQEDFFIEPSGRRTSVLSQTATLSTTAITAKATIGSTTSLSSRTANTPPNIQSDPSGSGRGRLESVRKWLARCGRIGKAARWSAESAAASSSPPECERLSVVTPSADELRRTDWHASRTLSTVTRTDNERVSATPVYNLTVAPGHLPEFYANGVLVHNCTWVPDESRKSPDRLDAYVHVLTGLLVKAPEGLWGGSIRAFSPGRRTLPRAPRVQPRSGRILRTGR